MAGSQRFQIRYGFFRPLLWLVGAGPRSAYVELDDDRVRARMGWTFRTEFPRASVTGVAPYTRMVTGIGVHGWRGRWLVNGSIRGLVAVDIEPPARAFVLGVPVKLRTLYVSMEEPEAVMAALRR